MQEYILANLANPQMQISDIAQAANSSERQLFRRIKELTGFSPNQFVQELRLQTAREWLENRQYSTVKEIALRVGFQKTTYFSKLYTQRFGVNPSDMIRHPTASPVESLT